LRAGEVSKIGETAGRLFAISTVGSIVGTFVTSFVLVPEVGTDQTLHVYSVDHEMKLWVLHQDSDRPWNDDGTPHWSPYIPLDKEVATVVSDTNPAAAPSLFA